MVVITFIVSFIISAVIGVMVGLGYEGKKGAIVGTIVTLVFTLIIGGGLTLDTMERDSKWNGGYCPNCEVHWIPFGASDTDFGAKSKYYYCPECFKEIQL